MSPHLDAVRVERGWLAGGVVRIAARTRELMVACPDCQCESARVHSRYSRTLADVAAGGRPVLISLTVRRLFCDSTDCGRRTFAEQVAETAQTHHGDTETRREAAEVADADVSFEPAQLGENISFDFGSNDEPEPEAIAAAEDASEDVAEILADFP